MIDSVDILELLITAGSVLREFSGQYLNSTLSEIQKDAKSGIQVARS